jgi:hypothetical protein
MILDERWQTGLGMTISCTAKKISTEFYIRTGRFAPEIWVSPRKELGDSTWFLKINFRSALTHQIAFSV